MMNDILTRIASHPKHTEGYLPIVDFEERVSASYWNELKTAIIPPAAADRVDQLLRYETLWNGFWDYYLVKTDRYVMNNLFRLTAVFLADIIVSYPPDIQYDGEPPVSNRFIASMLEAVYEALVDYSRYGTALMQVRIGMNGWEVVSPQPVYWFPVDDAQQTQLRFYTDNGVEQVDIFEDFGRGQSLLSTYKLSDGVTDKLVDAVPAAYGEDAAWQVVADETLGRVGQIVNIPRRPTTGDWGLSLYQDMAPLVFELTRILSQISYALKEGGNVKLKAIRSDNPGLDAALRASPPGQADRRDTLMFTQYHDILTDRDSIVVEPPPGYKDVQPLHMIGSLREHIAQAHLIQEQIFAHTFFPGVLYLLGGGQAPISGSSVREQYKRTVAYVRSTIATFQKAIRKVLLIGAVVNGASAAAVQDYAERLEIKWGNILDDDMLVEKDSDSEVVDEEEEDVEVVESDDEDGDDDEEDGDAENPFDN